MIWKSLSDDDQLERKNSQLLYEQRMLEYGVSRYWDDYNRAPDEAIPEQELIDSSIREMVDTYQEWIDKVCQSSRSPKWLYPLLELGAKKMADITIRAVIRNWFSSSFWGYRWNEDLHTPPLAQSVATDIAQDACDIIGFQRARDNYRDDWKKQSKFIKNWTTKRCRAFAKKMETNIKLSVKQKHDFGHNMLRIAASSNIVILNPRTIKCGGGLRKYNFVEFHQDVLKELHNRHEILQNSTLIYRPMLSPPEPHSLVASGGYLHTNLRKPVVQRYKSNFFGEKPKKQRFSEPSELVLEGINGMMYTEWTINTKVMDVMENLFKNNTSLANLPYYSFEEFMFNAPYPEEGTKQEKAIWCQTREEHWSNWYKDEQARGRMLVRLQLAKEMSSWNFFYHVYTLDFRGRAYTTCELLSPQSSDFDRGLIHFAQEVKLTERGRYWQKVHLSNLFGNDKVSFDDRVEWVEQKWDKIVAISEDPYTNKEWVDLAKKKNKSFQRLSAIFDITRTDGYTRMAVQLDGKCNGNQHWSAIMGDKDIAHLTSVTPDSKPQDLYQYVADGTTKYCKDFRDSNAWFETFVNHWDKGIDRVVTKRSTMCDAYGLTFYGIQRYLKEEGHLDWVPHEKKNGAIVEMARAIKASLDLSLKEPNKGKKYLREITAKANECNKHLSWTTPSGFKVTHFYNKVYTRRSLAKLFNNKELIFYVRTEDVHSRHAILAIAPNYIHSLDAAHMFMTVYGMLNVGITQFSMIHDSFGCNPNMVDKMRIILKNKFYEIHKDNQLERFKKEIEGYLGVNLPDVPTRGVLDIEGVLDSEYMFG